MTSDDLAAKVLERSEEERRRLARELHDDIGQRLAVLADDADRLRRAVELTDDTNRRRLDTLVRHARELSDDLRRISHALHPTILEDLGLVPALRSLTDDFAERTGMPANFIATNIPPDLAPPLATAAYRITQEALRNVSKHAGETSVRVRFECCASELVVVISDLGVGFDANHKTGLGLISMRERAHLAGGSFNLTSAIGKGTTIQVRLPLPTPIIIKPRN